MGKVSLCLSDREKQRNYVVYTYKIHTNTPYVYAISHDRASGREGFAAGGESFTQGKLHARKVTRSARGKLRVVRGKLRAGGESYGESFLLGKVISGESFLLGKVFLAGKVSFYILGKVLPWGVTHENEPLDLNTAVSGRAEHPPRLQWRLPACGEDLPLPGPPFSRF